MFACLSATTKTNVVDAAAQVVGWYYDPKHGHCLRQIKPDLTIVGVYGLDEPNTGQTWEANMTRVEEHKKSHKLRFDVDFEGKPGKVPRVMRAVYDDQTRMLKWSDDNVWFKLVVPPRLQKA